MDVSLDARVTALEENVGGSAGNGNLVRSKTFLCIFFLHDFLPSISIKMILINRSFSTEFSVFI